MSFSLVYIVHRAIYRIGDFFHHWYVDGSRRLFHGFISKLEELDKGFAFKITLRHFFEPLYKDYSIVGRILGIIFRTGRVLAGGIVYLLFSIFFLAIYLLWISIPAGLLGYALFILPR